METSENNIAGTAKPRFSFLPLQLFYEFFGNFGNFHGRTSRSDFWLTTLFFLVVGLFYTVPLIVLLFKGIVLAPGFWIIAALSILLSLVCVIPSLSITVRRLHDTGRSGLWMLVSFVPCVGSIILLVLLALAGQTEENKWGAPVNSVAEPADSIEMKSRQTKWTIGLACLLGLPVVICIITLALSCGTCEPDYGSYDDSINSYIENDEVDMAPEAPTHLVDSEEALSDFIDVFWSCSYEYIDLGLPSGKQWSDRNVGATQKVYYGSYFTYYAAFALGYTMYEGGGFGLPSTTDFKELVDNCEVTWSAGLHGYFFRSKINGRSIFFPAAGNYKDGELRNSTTDGDYWAWNANGKRAYNMDFNQSNITVRDSSPKSMYFTVRLVHDPSVDGTTDDNF